MSLSARLIENLKSNPASRLAELETERDAATTNVAAAEADLLRVSGVETARDEQIDAADRAVADARQTLRRAELRITGERQRVEDERRKIAAKAQAGRIKAVKKHLAERQEIAAEFSGHFAKAIDAYRRFFKVSDAAFMAFPGGAPPGLYLTHGEIVAAIANELFRVDGRHSDRRLAEGEAPQFPAPSPPSLRFVDCPTMITPLADRIAKANQFAISRMDGNANAND